MAALALNPSQCHQHSTCSLGIPLLQIIHQQLRRDNPPAMTAYCATETCCPDSASKRLSLLFLQVYSKQEGQFSPRTAEMRADLGKATTDLHVMQTFDGPAPETINGKLAT